MGARGRFMHCLPGIPSVVYEACPRQICDFRMSVLLILACLHAAGLLSAADAPAATILGRVGEVYGGAIDYQLTADCTAIRRAGDSPVVTTTRVRYRLAASKPRAFLVEATVLAPKQYEVRVGTDGESAWAYSPGENRYRKGGPLG